MASQHHLSMPDGCFREDYNDGPNEKLTQCQTSNRLVLESPRGEEITTDKHQ
jgi:hypothetical protein